MQEQRPDDSSLLLKAIKDYLEEKSSKEKQKQSETTIKNAVLKNIQLIHILQVLNIKEPFTIGKVEKHCWMLIELLQKNPHISFIKKDIDVLLSRIKYFEHVLDKVKVKISIPLINKVKKKLNVLKRDIDTYANIYAAKVLMKAITFYLDEKSYEKKEEISWAKEAQEKNIREAEKIIKNTTVESMQLLHILHALNIKEPATMEMAERHCWVLIELLEKNPYIRFKLEEINAFSAGVKNFETVLSGVKIRRAAIYDVTSLQHFKDDLNRAKKTYSIIDKAKGKVNTILRQNVLIQELAQTPSFPMCEKHQVNNFFEYEYRRFRPFQYQALLERAKVEKVNWEQIYIDTVAHAKEFLKLYAIEDFVKLKENEQDGQLVFWFKHYLEKVSHPESYSTPNMAETIVEQSEIIGNGDSKKIFQLLAIFAPASKKLKEKCEQEIVPADYANIFPEKFHPDEISSSKNNVDKTPIKCFPDGTLPSQDDFKKALQTFFPYDHRYISLVISRRGPIDWKKEFFKTNIVSLTSEQRLLFRYTQKGDLEGIKRLNPSWDMLLTQDHKGTDFFQRMIQNVRDGQYTDADEQKRNLSERCSDILRMKHNRFGKECGLAVTWRLFDGFTAYLPDPEKEVVEEQSQLEEKRSLFEEDDKKEEQQGEQKQGEQLEELKEHKKNPPRNINPIDGNEKQQHEEKLEEKQPDEKRQNPSKIISLYDLAQNRTEEKSIVLQKGFFAQNENKPKEDKEEQKTLENKNSITEYNDRSMLIFVAEGVCSIHMFDQLSNVQYRSKDTILRVKEKIKEKYGTPIEHIVLLINKRPISKEFNSLTVRQVEEMQGGGQQIQEARLFEKEPKLAPNGVFLNERRKDGISIEPASDDRVAAYYPKKP